jgi:hypothetical protein
MGSVQDFREEVLKDKDIPVFNEATHHEDISFHIVVWSTLLTLRW